MGVKMATNARVTYRRTCRYNTARNKVKITRTPGGRYVYQHQKKAGGYVHCKECHGRLAGIKKMRPSEKTMVAPHKRTVARAYGGNLCGGCLRTRILRGHIREEYAIVRSLLIEKRKLDKAKGQK